MSLLAGLKFVKKPPPGADNGREGGGDGPETVEGEKQKGEKERRHKDKKKDKRKDKKKKVRRYMWTTTLQMLTHPILRIVTYCV